MDATCSWSNTLVLRLVAFAFVKAVPTPAVSVAAISLVTESIILSLPAPSITISPSLSSAVNLVAKPVTFVEDIDT